MSDALLIDNKECTVSDLVGGGRYLFRNLDNKIRRGTWNSEDEIFELDSGKIWCAGDFDAAKTIEEDNV